MTTGDGKTLAVTILSICVFLIVALVGIGVYALTGPVGDWAKQIVTDMRRDAAHRPTTMGDGQGDPVIDPSTPRPVPPADPRLARAGLKGNPGQWFGDDAYPVDAIRAGEQGRTVARLGIDPSGTPRSCAIVQSSGSRSLDAATCAVALRRVTFDPARDEQGRPIASSFTLPVRWVLPTR